MRAESEGKAFTMSDTSLHTTEFHKLIDLIQSGDRAARDELLRRVCDRLEQLARKMLHRYPSVKRWVQTDDVLQNALLRLLRALEEVRPPSMRDFFNLAAAQMRRELLDIARHFHGPEGLAAHHASGHGKPDGVAEPQEPADRSDDPEDLERWSAFHEEVERLPAELREVVSLIFYHGWSQREVADLFGVDERTIRRRWSKASLHLHQALAGRMPELTE